VGKQIQTLNDCDYISIQATVTQNSTSQCLDLAFLNYYLRAGLFSYCHNCQIKNY